MTLEMFVNVQSKMRVEEIATHIRRIRYNRIVPIRQNPDLLNQGPKRFRSSLLQHATVGQYILHSLSNRRELLGKFFGNTDQ